MAAAIESVEDRRDLSADEFTRRFLQRSVPVVLRGEPAAQRLAEICSLARMEARFGDVRVPVKRATSRVFHARPDEEPDRVVEMTVRALAAYVRAPPAGVWCYLHQVTVDAFGRELTDAIALPAVLGAGVAGRRRMWIGPPGSATALHHDLSDNLVMMADGTKRVTLFDPYQGRYLYPHPASSEAHHVSRIAFDGDGAADAAEFPLFERAARAVVVVEAGDVLFIPAHWWHFAENLSAAVSLNVWW